MSRVGLPSSSGTRYPLIPKYVHKRSPTSPEPADDFPTTAEPTRRTTNVSCVDAPGGVRVAQTHTVVRRIDPAASSDATNGRYPYKRTSTAPFAAILLRDRTAGRRGVNAANGDATTH